MAQDLNDSPPASASLSKRTLGLLAGGAVSVAAIVAVLFVLPAQFGVDPTGFGKATGLTKLGAPAPQVVEAKADASAAHFYETPLRTDTITILLPPSGTPGYELEYKVRMKKGASMVYAWTADADPKEEAFYYDFHGETPAEPPAKPVVATYKQLTAVSSSGALTAPIDGVHGWYFLNDTLKVATVKLRISGFYELVPPGGYGNEGGVKADGQ
jgi:hypothetical protein